jgi:hypothetical protein
MSEDQRRRTQLSVRLESGLRDTVERQARSERRSVSNYLETVIAAAVSETPERAA